MGSAANLDWTCRKEQAEEEYAKRDELLRRQLHDIHSAYLAMHVRTGTGPTEQDEMRAQLEQLDVIMSRE